MTTETNDLTPAEIRQANERRVITNLIEFLANRKFKVVGVFDGENSYRVESTEQALEHIFSVDECDIWFKRENEPEHGVLIVLGNADDGSEVIADWNYSKGDDDRFNEAMEEFSKTLWEES